MPPGPPPPNSTRFLTFFNYVIRSCRQFFIIRLVLYHQTKTPINFWCRQKLNPKFLIQPSKTLSVELTETNEHLFYLNNHFYTFLLLFSFKISLSSEIKFVASHPSLIPNTQLLPYLASHLSQPCRHRCCCSASSSQPPLPLLCFFFTTQLSLLVLILHRYGFFFFFVATAGASSSFVQYRFDDSYFFCIWV